MPANTIPCKDQRDITNLMVQVPISRGLTEISLNDYKPRRFGLKYSPPTIVLEYLVPSSGKLYHHKMRVSLESNSSTTDVASAIIKKHSKYFKPSSLLPTQIESLVAKLHQHKFGNLEKNENIDAKKVDTKNENSNFINMRSKESENKKYDFPQLKAAKPNEGYDKLDLCKLTDEELDQHKKKMDELFQKNNIDINNAQFQYDIEMDFKPAGKSEWDDDADDDFK